MQIYVSRENNINNITGTSGNVATSYKLQAKISWPKILQKFTTNTTTTSYLVMTLIGQEKCKLIYLFFHAISLEISIIKLAAIHIHSLKQQWFLWKVRINLA